MATRKPITLTTKVSAIEAAIAVAQYMPLDPAIYLERAGLAGMHVFTFEGGLCSMWHTNGLDADQDQVDFLESWLNLTEGGREAVIDLLERRYAESNAGAAQ